MAFDFSKIKGKKIEKDSTKAEALKNVLGGIASDASKKIAGNLKKVTVASDDKEGGNKLMSLRHQIDAFNSDGGGKFLGVLEIMNDSFSQMKLFQQ